MQKKAIIPENAPIAGPYSPAISANGFVYVSGQIPMDSNTGKLVEGDIKIQAEQCFKNLINVLSAAELTTDNVVKSNIFLTDIKDFAAVNEVYAKYFNKPYPARSAFAVAALPLGATVEIEVVATK